MPLSPMLRLFTLVDTLIDFFATLPLADDMPLSFDATYDMARRRHADGAMMPRFATRHSAMFATLLRCRRFFRHATPLMLAIIDVCYADAAIACRCYMPRYAFFRYATMLQMRLSCR